MRKSRRDGFGENGFEGWGGYMAAKKAKLLDQFNSEAVKEGSKQQTTAIFHGISIYVNGYTVPSADELKRIMMVYGGQYHHYYSTERTTFIIASNLADTKIKQLKGQPKVVKPSWISDCVSAEKLLDYRPYLLYSNQSKSQPKITFPGSESFNSENKIASHSKHNPLEIESSKVKSEDKSLVKRPKYGELALEVSRYVKSTSSNESRQQNTELIEIAHDQQEAVSEHLETEIKLNQPIKIEQESFDENSKSNKSSEDNCSLEIIEKSECSDSNLNSDERKIQNSSELKSNDKETPSSNDNKTTNKEALRQGQKIARAGEANFLSDFYNNSRLHHISTMGAMFKKYISDLRKNHNGNFPGRIELIAWKQEQISNDENTWTMGHNEKIIMHIDMDCFFVSVGLRNYPELRGLPVAVTHAKGNNPQSARQAANRAAEFECYKQKLENKFGVSKNAEKTVEEALKSRMKWAEDLVETSSMAEIASCSYEAREAGLKNGMFMGTALKLCPNLKTIPYDFEGYKEVSFILYNTVASFTMDIEAVSCDEMFADCTAVLKETSTPPLEFATFLRNKIKSQTGCPASTGFGGNILQARLATKKAKPDGQYHLVPEDVSTFMQDISVEDLPGVGRNIAYRLKSQHILTCGDLQNISQTRLQSEYGHKTGLSLHQHCRGIDERVLDMEHTRKSVSAEVNYGIRFTERTEASAFIRELASEVQSRLEEINKKGRCVTLKLMVKAKDAPSETAKYMGHGVCDSVSRSSTLPLETCDAAVIAREAITLLGQLAVPPSSLRGMGIQVSKLTEKSANERNLNHFFLTRNKGDLMQDKGQPGTSGLTGNKAQTKIQDQPSTSTNMIEETTVPAALDEDFLAALPEDIRAEVIQDYQQGQHITQYRVKDQQSSATSSDLKQTLENVTFSQIDPSYLEALPEDLRSELMSDLGRKLPNSEQRPKSPHKQTALQSPTKTVSTSPRKGKGSPRMKSKQALLKGQQKINLLLSSPTKSKCVLPPVEDNKPAATVTRPESPEETSDDGGVLNPRIPLEQALKLIREWVDSTELPQPIDGDLMSEFLQQLVVTRRIDRVGALLRTMHRKIEEKKSSNWENIYQQIVTQVQLIMQKEYGAKLKVMETFHNS